MMDQEGESNMGEPQRVPIFSGTIIKKRKWGEGVGLEEKPTRVQILVLYLFPLIWGKSLTISKPPFPFILMDDDNCWHGGWLRGDTVMPSDWQKAC